MQKHHHDTIHEFFQSFSRVIIIFPVFIVVIALILKFSTSETTKKNTYSTIVIQPSPLVTKKDTVINLAGPFSCSFNRENALWSTLIQNRMILAVSIDKMKTINYLFRDDCIFSWEKNKYSGTKICGIGQFLLIGENLINSGLMSDGMFDMLVSQSKTILPLPIQYKDIQKAFSSCRLIDTIPVSQFEVPKQVLFKSK